MTPFPARTAPTSGFKRGERAAAGRRRHEIGRIPSIRFLPIKNPFRSPVICARENRAADAQAPRAGAAPRTSGSHAGAGERAGPSWGVRLVLFRRQPLSASRRAVRPSRFLKRSTLELTPQRTSELFMIMVSAGAQMALPLMLTVLVIGMASQLLQVGFIVSSESVKPKLERIDPIRGLKRIFSRRALMELAKSRGEDRRRRSSGVLHGAGQPGTLRPAYGVRRGSGGDAGRQPGASNGPLAGPCAFGSGDLRLRIPSGTSGSNRCG